MSITDKDLQTREILTKAVCGKGRKFSQVSHTVTPPHAPTSILGAWIINHQYEAVHTGDGVEVNGTYDIDYWYSYENNTKTDVGKETISYVEVIPLTYFDNQHRSSTAEVTADATQEPNCVEATISASGDSVKVRVEREFQVEMVAETKMCVVVDPDGCDQFGDKAMDFVNDESDDFEDLELDLFDDEIS